MAASSAVGATPLRLRCLAGGAAPDHVSDSAARLARMTEAAIGNLSDVLRPCVVQKMTPEMAQRLSRYSVAHEVAEADLGHVVRVCIYLLREAAAANAPPGDLEADARTTFERAAGDEGSKPLHEAAVAMLLREYEALRPTLRTERIVDALVKHGNVLVDVDWRVDVVTTDRRALRLGTPVAIVTFAYRNADKNERLTLQFTPEQLDQMEKMFGALAQRAKQPVA
jgi:CRP-like cAMP-binding protein